MSGYIPEHANCLRCSVPTPSLVSIAADKTIPLCLRCQGETVGCPIPALMEGWPLNREGRRRENRAIEHAKTRIQGMQRT